MVERHLVDGRPTRRNAARDRTGNRVVAVIRMRGPTRSPAHEVLPSVTDWKPAQRILNHEILSRWQS